MPAHGVTGLTILDDLSKEVNDGKLSLRSRQSRLARRDTLLNYYQDIYWHRVGAVKEKQQVFIEPMMQLAVQIFIEQFTVCELGFGFGLNCMLQQNNGIPRTQLPTKPDINRKSACETVSTKKCLQLHNFKHTSAMVKQYSLPTRPTHNLACKQHQITSDLDEVDKVLANLDAELDCRMGFHRAKRGHVHPSLYNKMYSRSRPGAGVATYTAAGHVRRGLNAAGFKAKRIPGFNKKEMLRANSPGEWRARSHQLKDVTIVGAFWQEFIAPRLSAVVT